MSVVSLPTRTDLGRYTFSVALTGVVFRLGFYFNRRDQHWYFDVLDPTGLRLRSGFKVVSKFALLRQWVQQGRPVGEIVAVDPASDDPPGLEELGERVILVYDDENL